MQATDKRLRWPSLDGLSDQDAAIWLDMVNSGWRNHPKALPLQLVGLSMMALLIAKSSLTMAQWLPTWGSMVLVCVTVIGLAFRFRRTQLTPANYQPWRLLLLGWRALHGVAGGVLCAMLYGALDREWQLPLLITVVVFTYGLTFFAIEAFGLAMGGTAPLVLCLPGTLSIHTRAAPWRATTVVTAARSGAAGRVIDANVRCSVAATPRTVPPACSSASVTGGAADSRGTRGPGQPKDAVPAATSATERRLISVPPRWEREGSVLLATGAKLGEHGRETELVDATHPARGHPKGDPALLILEPEPLVHEVDLEAPLGVAVRVADIRADERLLPGDLALARHGTSP